MVTNQFVVDSGPQRNHPSHSEARCPGAAIAIPSRMLMPFSRTVQMLGAAGEPGFGSGFGAVPAEDVICVSAGRRASFRMGPAPRTPTRKVIGLLNGKYFEQFMSPRAPSRTTIWVGWSRCQAQRYVAGFRKGSCDDVVGA